MSRTMDTASLRIKFTPLLKKICNHKYPDSNCCIEIVPELSAIQNLEKLQWKLENGLIEYTIPMTYKIMIRKSELIKDECEDKVYHSCVDLLHTCSISNSNFASGDIMRITSDNVFLKRIASESDSGDFLMTKNLINTKDLFESIMARRTTSIQTLSPCEAGSLISQQPLTVDKSLEFDINDINKKSTYTIVPNVHSLLKIHDDNNSRKSDPFVAGEETFNEDYSTKFVNVDTRLNGDVPKHANLFPPPICSLNTYDVLPVAAVCSKRNASTYTLSRNSFDKSNETKIKSYRTHIDSTRNVRKNVVLNTFTQLHQCHKIQNKATKLNDFDIKRLSTMHDNMKSLEPDYDKLITLSSKKLNVFDRNITKHNFLEPQGVFVTNKANMDFTDRKRRIKHKKIDFLNKFSLFNENYIHDTEDMIRRKYKRTNENERSVCKFNKHNLNFDLEDENYNKNVLRVRPEVRVAKFVQNLETEIYPLKQMLNDIKCKCMVLGLYNGEFISMAKTKINKPASNFDSQNPVIQETPKETTKSNRVVYTFYFND